MSLKRFLSFAVALFVTPSAFAEGVVWFEADSGQLEVSYRERQLSAIKKYELEELLGDGWELRLFPTSPYQLSNPVNFTGVTGLLTHSRANGAIVRLRVWTADSPEVFAKFIESLVAARGDKVQITGPDNDKTIRVTEAQKLENPTREVKWDDIRVVFADGVIALGPPSSLEGISLTDFKPILEAAKGKHWYYYFNPRAADPKYWKAIVDKTIGATAPSLQQFDHETDEEYAVRRRGLEAKLSVLQSVIEGTAEFSAWTEWPKNDKEPFQFGARLIAQEESALKKLIQGIRPASETLPDFSRDRFALAATLNMSLPDALRSWGIVEASRIEDESVRALLRSILSLESFATTVAVHPAPSRKLQVSGVADRIDDQTLQRIAGRVLDDESVLSLPIVPAREYVGVPLEMAIMRRKGPSMEFCIADASVHEVSIPISSEKQLAPRPGEIARVSINAFSPTDDQSAQGKMAMWMAVESLYDSWMEESFRERFKVGFDNNYPSFTPRLTETGDWTANASVTVFNDGVTIKGQLGSSLHEMFVARGIVANRLQIKQMKGKFRSP